MAKLFFTTVLLIFTLIIFIASIAYIINFVDLSLGLYTVGRVILIGFIISFSGGGFVVVGLSEIRQITRIIKEKNGYEDELPREPLISIGKIRASMGRIFNLKRSIIFVYVSVFLIIIVAGGIIWKVVYRDSPLSDIDDNISLVSNPDINHQEYIEIPSEDLGDIIGTGSISSMYKIFSGRIYNGCSDWAVKKMIARITVEERDGTIRWSRDFYIPIDLLPLSVKGFILDVDDVDNVGSYQWNIVKVWGHKSENL